MTEHHDSHIPDTSSVEHWDERYSGEQVWSGSPNQALVDEVTGLAPGTALDVGCGEGADSVWLAQQGWAVTALDISRRAVERTRAAADAAGVHLDTVAAPFLEARLTAPFGLVSAMYPVLETTPEHDAERRLAELVAPGGTLLFVHHLPNVDSGFDPSAYVAPGDVASFLREQGGWQIVTDEQRERHVHSGGGAGHHIDVVVRATRSA